MQTGAASNRAAVKKDILLVNNRRRGGEHYGNCVEANLTPVETGASDVRASCADNALFLTGIDGALRAAKLGRGAGFHFDENQRAAIASYDIDFGVSGVGAVISGDNSEAGTAEIAMRQVLPAAAERGSW